MVLALISCVATVVYAATYYWSMEITWTTADETIGVYTDVDCTIPWDNSIPYTYTNISIPSTETLDFYIKNEGDVPINVTVVDVVAISGGSAGWSPTSLMLDIGQVKLMTLTLTFEAEGSYKFDFSSTKQ